MQGYPRFAAAYSGPNSLPPGGQVEETLSLDVVGGLRLWQGAEVHADGMMWQGYGLANSEGVEAFPNGEAYRVGTRVPNAMLSRLFIRQTIGFGGKQETVEDSAFSLAGRRDLSRLTITIGRFAASDIFDQNSYANSPNTQFLNWGLINNEAWDYPADAVGFTTGLAAEWNHDPWTLRYGVFQVPRFQNGLTWEDRFLKWPYQPDRTGPCQDGPLLSAWGMVAEVERRYVLGARPGTIRVLAYLNRAAMASYAQATALLLAQGPDADLSPAASYRCKYGFGLNWEQQVTDAVGIFSRLGWNDDRESGWMFGDVGSTISLGTSVGGTAWRRPDDTLAIAVLANAASGVEQRFLAAGGRGILAGDGALSYGVERVLETYYDADVGGNVHLAADYQLVGDPAFNRDRGPVSVFAARLHLGY